jgi:hypothetical protein
MEVREAHDWPELALDLPHWSRLSEYCPAVTLSYWPQCEEVSIAAARSSTIGAARMKGIREAKNINLGENIVDLQIGVYEFEAGWI